MGIMKQLKVLGVATTTTTTTLSLQSQDDLQRQKRHAAVTLDFKKLHEELKAEGFFEPSLWHLAYRIVEILLLAILGLYFLKMGETTVSHVTGILLSSLSIGKCDWLQHEGSHVSLTGRKRIDRFIQTVTYALATGLSPAWWTSQHGKHHAMTNRLERDVDMDTMPLLAFSSKILDHHHRRQQQKAMKNDKNFPGREEADTPVRDGGSDVGGFDLEILRASKVCLGEQKVRGPHLHDPELLSDTLCGVLGLYITCMWLIATYIFGNMALSHSHLPMTEGPLHWVEYGLLKSLDIDSKWCPWLVDWWMGYLNFQVEHHLFPAMPQFRNRRMRDRVKALAQKHGIAYLCTSYSEAVLKTMRNLHNVANHQDKTA